MGAVSRTLSWLVIWDGSALTMPTCSTRAVIAQKTPTIAPRDVQKQWSWYLDEDPNVRARDVVTDKLIWKKFLCFARSTLAMVKIANVK